MEEAGYVERSVRWPAFDLCWFFSSHHFHFFHSQTDAKAFSSQRREDLEL